MLRRIEHRIVLQIPSRLIKNYSNVQNIFSTIPTILLKNDANYLLHVKLFQYYFCKSPALSVMLPPMSISTPTKFVSSLAVFAAFVNTKRYLTEICSV